MCVCLYSYPYVCLHVRMPECLFVCMAFLVCCMYACLYAYMIVGLSGCTSACV